MINPIINSVIISPPIPEFLERIKTLEIGATNIFDMTQAVPSVPTPEKICSALANSLTESDTSFYTAIEGLECLRLEIAKQHPLSSSLDIENIIITAGANHAMYTALQLFLKSGDKLGLIEPYYFNHDMAAKILGYEPVYKSLENSGFDLVAQEIIDWIEASQVKAIILITPNNPTGAKYNSNEILSILKYTSKKQIEVIIDETYIAFDPNHLDHQLLSDYIGQGLTLVGSFSKTYSLTGYRVGYLISGRAEIQQALKIQDTLLICAPHLSQIAAYTALTECADFVEGAKRVIEEKTKFIVSQTKQLENFKIASVGAYFAYLKHPFLSLSSEDAAIKLFKNTGILSLPGSIFGASQSGYLRLAYCNLDMPTLDKAVRALVKFDCSLS
jgi:aspartate/methionine/tyrosine aminotransferase